MLTGSAAFSNRTETTSTARAAAGTGSGTDSTVHLQLAGQLMQAFLNIKYSDSRLKNLLSPCCLGLVV
jgi:hypothetical protein